MAVPAVRRSMTRVACVGAPAAVGDHGATYGWSSAEAESGMNVGFGWKLHGDGRSPRPGAVVKPDERLSWGRTVGLGAQHVVAMFGATLVEPVLVG